MEVVVARQRDVPTTARRVWAQQPRLQPYVCVCSRMGCNCMHPAARMRGVLQAAGGCRLQAAGARLVAHAELGARECGEYGKRCACGAWHMVTLTT